MLSDVLLGGKNGLFVASSPVWKNELQRGSKQPAPAVDLLTGFEGAALPASPQRVGAFRGGGTSPLSTSVPVLCSFERPFVPVHASAYHSLSPPHDQTHPWEFTVDLGFTQSSSYLLGCLLFSCGL